MVRLNREQLIEHITNEVMKRLDGLRPQVGKAARSLVIVDESPFWLDSDILAQIREIHNREGISGVVVIKDATIGDGSLLSQRIEGFGLSVTNGRNLGSGVFKLIDGIENVYILGFAASNASRICMLLDDNTVCKAVQYSLINGKNLYVSDLLYAVDCTRANKGYIDKIKSLSKELVSYGVQSMTGTSGREDPVGQARKEKGTGVRRVICLEDIRDCNTDVLEIESDSILTPLALEYIRDKKIRISMI